MHQQLYNVSLYCFFLAASASDFVSSCFPMAALLFKPLSRQSGPRARSNPHVCSTCPRSFLSSPFIPSLGPQGTSPPRNPSPEISSIERTGTQSIRQGVKHTRKVLLALECPAARDDAGGGREVGAGRDGEFFREVLGGACCVRTGVGICLPGTCVVDAMALCHTVREPETGSRILCAEQRAIPPLPHGKHLLSPPFLGLPYPPNAQHPAFDATCTFAHQIQEEKLTYFQPQQP